jgi:hypothetical protein
MKLITEYIDDGISTLTEATTSGKNVFLSGVFMESNKKNRNGREYPKDVLEGAVHKYVTEFVDTCRAGGELNHPSGPAVNPERISHRITELKWSGDDVVGKALVLNTPMGLIVKGLIEGGMKLGVSSRGMGSIESKNGRALVKNDFRLATVDVVHDPSAPSAFVNGIMEGVEWVWDNGILKAQQIEIYETVIKKASSRNLAEVQSKVFADFLSKLK